MPSLCPRGPAGVGVESVRPTAGGRPCRVPLPQPRSSFQSGPGFPSRPAHSAALRLPLGSEAARTPAPMCSESKPWEEDQFWLLSAKASSRGFSLKGTVARRTLFAQCRGAGPAHGAETSDREARTPRRPPGSRTLGTPRNQVGSPDCSTLYSPSSEEKPPASSQ